MDGVVRQGKPAVEHAGNDELVGIRAGRQPGPGAHSRASAIRPDHEAGAHPLSAPLVVELDRGASSRSHAAHLDAASYLRARFLGQPE